MFKNTADAKKAFKEKICEFIDSFENLYVLALASKDDQIAKIVHVQNFPLIMANSMLDIEKNKIIYELLTNENKEAAKND